MTICAQTDGKSWASCTRGIQGCICGFDSPHRVAHVLQVHNQWRRGEIEIDESPCPAAVGMAIDAAIEIVKASALKDAE